ncbi:DNA repair protein [Mycena indigotica]|uniref:DNA repair protein n=1 Tax=Mycena indigotica TaxID=2126181 RepID=A0A8H6SXY5_9AGAR|nr:DNA repair protein [Mycena indigotica]KAF7307476.1 DNA repair protein [Mycena indigotica]
MSDSEMPTRPPLFFASSDSEDEDVPMDAEAEPATSERASSPASSRLFSEGSDAEKDPIKKRPILVDSDSDSAKNAARKPPPAKKRRVSPPPPPPSPPAVQLMYLGDLVWGHGWSNVSGKGYIKPGEEVKIKRETVPTKAENKAVAKGKKGGDGKKQMSLAAMLKQPSKTAAAKSKKTDTIVRLYNSRGFQIGRLPDAVSSWVARLLDLDIIEFRGQMVDCPERLTTGCNLVISVGVYMLPTAFQPSKMDTDTNEKPPVMFSEGVETLDEQLLRERKASILKLFDELNLRPTAGANFAQRKSDEEIHDEAMKKMAPAKSKKVTEIVGDGEEIEVEEGEEVTDNDLAMIFQKAQKGDRAMGEMDPPETFTLSLRGYQKQALLWMSSIELGKMDAREAASMHPLWSQYLFPLPHSDGIIDLTADQKPFYFNPYSGELSLDFPKAERQGRGGILALVAHFALQSADETEMGMGKTIELAALIHTNCEPDIDRPVEEKPVGNKHRQLKLSNAFKKVPRKKGAKPPTATLIVAPTSLLAQWESELQRCSKPGTLETVVWHGQNRLDLQGMLDDDDAGSIKVVVTSYGVLASEHAKVDKSKSPLFEVEWLRVVLDEAHACKSRTSKTAKAVYALSARRRWAVTGTPIVNKLEDLYSLLKFLDFKPWADFSFFRSFITLPFLAHDPKAIEIVQIILESILLRREKTMLDTNGKRIVELPPKEVVVEYLDFSSLERRIYDSLFNSAKRDFLRLDAKGLVGKNYTHILAMLMRLRRAVLHPNLVLTSRDEPNKSSQDEEDIDVNELIQRFANDDDAAGANVFAQNALQNLDIPDDDAECPVCMDVMELPMVIPECMHRCCKDCLLTICAKAEEGGKDATCPTCSRGPIREKELMEVFRPPRSSQNPEPAVILRKNDFRSSTKLDALMHNLRFMQESCGNKIRVSARSSFSQFTSFLDLIQIVLKRDHFEHYRFDGSMDVKTRGAAIEQFKAPARKAKVLVVSLKAGGVGLNLTVANHVFMMDCWWNAAIENQAIDRVHRIGQEKTVYVKHFIIAHTIEGRILQIQKRKTAIIKEAFRSSGDGKGDPESIENLKIMFGDEEE